MKEELKINKEEKIKQVEKILEGKKDYLDELETKIDVTQNKQAKLIRVQLVEEIRELFFELEKLQTELRGEDTNMNNNEIKLETRTVEYGLNEMIRGEERALQMTADGATLIPENVENSIVLKMEEISPIFEKARKLTTDSGELRVARENDTIEVGFVGEGANVLEKQINFDYVKLSQKRVGAAIALSNQLINDSSVDIESYVGDLLARRTVRAIEKSMLTGTREEEFQGIVHDEFIQNIDVVGEVSIDDLQDMYLAVHPEFLKDSSFIMSRDFFNKVAKWKDHNGNYLLQNGTANGKINYVLLGMPVEVTDSLPAENPVIFGNLAESVSMLIKRGAKLQKITGDTTQSIRGSVLYVYDMYLDSAVTNPQGLVKLTVTQ